MYKAHKLYKNICELFKAFHENTWKHFVFAQFCTNQNICRNLPNRKLHYIQLCPYRRQPDQESQGRQTIMQTKSKTNSSKFLHWILMASLNLNLQKVNSEFIYNILILNMVVVTVYKKKQTKQSTLLSNALYIIYEMFLLRMYIKKDDTCVPFL